MEQSCKAAILWKVSWGGLRPLSHPVRRVWVADGMGAGLVMAGLGPPAAVPCARV